MIYGINHKIIIKMTKPKIFRSCHSFFIPSYKNTTRQEQSSGDNKVKQLALPFILNDAPDFKIKIGLERFMEKYPDYKQMFVGSRK